MPQRLRPPRASGIRGGRWQWSRSRAVFARCGGGAFVGLGLSYSAAPGGAPALRDRLAIIEPFAPKGRIAATLHEDTPLVALRENRGQRELCISLPIQRELDFLYIMEYNRYSKNGLTTGDFCQLLIGSEPSGKKGGGHEHWERSSGHRGCPARGFLRAGLRPTRGNRLRRRNERRNPQHGCGSRCGRRMRRAGARGPCALQERPRGAPCG